MICAIHQPNFLPYLGFFDKFKKSDVFVLYDTAQYSKNDFHNRNRIKINNTAYWLTVPVNVVLGQEIKDVSIASNDFVEKHLRTIKQNYSKAKHFDEVFPDIEKIYKENKTGKLADLNIAFLRMIFTKFDANKRVVLSSDIKLGKDSKSTNALIAICKKIGADKYLSGRGAEAYLAPALFAENGIELVWQEFKHPKYNQLGDVFLDNLSVLDALFNLGYSGTYNLL